MLPSTSLQNTMAKSKTPVESTYSTKYIPLFKELNSRGVFTGETKDNSYVNVFPDFTKNKVTQENYLEVVKRAGSTKIIDNSLISSGAVRGMFFWPDEDKLYLFIEGDVYTYTASTMVIISVIPGVFSALGTPIGTDLFLYDTGVVKIVATDGTTVVTIDSSDTVVASTDPDLPAHLPYPVCLDGYLFLVAEDSGDIYNSDLNDPLAWTPGNFMTAEILGDRITYLSRLNNYLLAFGNNSIEYFWDAGNSSGSPLQRNDTPVKMVGFIGGFARLGNKIYFVGSYNGGLPNVFVLKDMTIEAIADEVVREHLVSLSTSLQNVSGNIVSMYGREFYVLDTGTNGRTWVMELETQLWHRWIRAGNFSNRFPIQYASSVITNNKAYSIFSLYNNLDIYRIDDSVYQDIGFNYTCTIITEKEDFDTIREKTMGRLVVRGDRPPVDTNISIEYTDDDYQTYSVARTINLNQKKPTATQLGTFNERAFRLTYTANQPLRIKSLEVDINMGNS